MSKKSFLEIRIMKFVIDILNDPNATEHEKEIAYGLLQHAEENDFE